MSLTVEEKTIIQMYSGFNPDRKMVISSMQQSLPLVEDKEIAALMNSVIRKINAMTNADFTKINLSDALDADTQEK